MSRPRIFVPRALEPKTVELLQTRCDVEMVTSISRNFIGGCWPNFSKIVVYQGGYAFLQWRDDCPQMAVIIHHQPMLHCC